MEDLFLEADRRENGVASRQFFCGRRGMERGEMKSDK